MAHDLENAFREFRLEYGIQAAVETIAADCTDLAQESGAFGKPENYEIAGIVWACATQMEPYDK